MHLLFHSSYPSASSALFIYSSACSLEFPFAVPSEACLIDSCPPLPSLLLSLTQPPLLNYLSLFLWASFFSLRFYLPALDCATASVFSLMPSCFLAPPAAAFFLRARLHQSPSFHSTPRSVICFLYSNDPQLAISEVPALRTYCKPYCKFFFLGFP